ncbi:MAG: hypothetical protein K1Y36_30520 [Blastocatellia bacterium]|nr:hypothetical protein [Blastocatellia bacterium]
MFPPPWGVIGRCRTGLAADGGDGQFGAVYFNMTDGNWFSRVMTMIARSLRLTNKLACRSLQKTTVDFPVRLLTGGRVGLICQLVFRRACLGNSPVFRWVPFWCAVVPSGSRQSGRGGQLLGFSPCFLGLARLVRPWR